MSIVLITGGAGFIGSHLIDRLINDGHQIICLDNFFTGSKDNVRHWIRNPHFELIRHDITMPILLEVDRIFNLACPASPIHYKYNPVKTIKTSVIGMINMLGLAKRVKARILQASTSEVYGCPEVHPQIEDYWGNVNPIGARSCYDEGKRVAECIMMDYHRQSNIDIRIARIFNTYGPRMAINDGRVVSNFIVQALRGEKLAVYGDGKQTRSFCYIDDLVEGLTSLMDKENLYAPVNLGNPHEITMLELAEEIFSIIGSKVQIEYKELPEDDPQQRLPDIERAKEKLSWQPTVNLRQGLTKTIEYFDKIVSHQ